MSGRTLLRSAAWVLTGLLAALLSLGTVDLLRLERIGDELDARVQRIALLNEYTLGNQAALALALDQSLQIDQIEAERANFERRITAAERALKKAKQHRLTTSAERKKLHRLQEEFLYEYQDLGRLRELADDMGAVTKRLDRRLRALLSRGGGDWWSRISTIWRSIGGDPGMLQRGNGRRCAGAAACTIPGRGSSTVVVMEPAVGRRSYSRQYWTAMHELAHVYQLQIWNSIHASSRFRSMFSGDVELLANCMASARGATDHGHRCTTTMITKAARVWRGKAP